MQKHALVGPYLGAYVRALVLDRFGCSIRSIVYAKIKSPFCVKSERQMTRFDCTAQKNSQSEHKGFIYALSTCIHCPNYKYRIHTNARPGLIFRCITVYSSFTSFKYIK